MIKIAYPITLSRDLALSGFEHARQSKCSVYVMEAQIIVSYFHFVICLTV